MPSLFLSTAPTIGLTLPSVSGSCTDRRIVSIASSISFRGLVFGLADECLPLGSALLFP